MRNPLKKIRLAVLAFLLWQMFFCPMLFGASSESEKIDRELTAVFKKMLAGDDKLGLAAEFKRRLVKQLGNPITLSHTLKQLSESSQLTICASADKKIKFYSWDDQTGGTWRAINVLAQFASDRGRIVIQPISSGEEAQFGTFTDAAIDEVHDLRIGETTYYLTFGSGTHGSGQHHFAIQLFKIEGAQLRRCRFVSSDVYPEASHLQKDGSLVIEYPRSETMSFSFEPESREIILDEFKFYPKRATNLPTGRTIKITLKSAPLCEGGAR